MQGRGWRGMGVMYVQCLCATRSWQIITGVQRTHPGQQLKSGCVCVRVSCSCTVSRTYLSFDGVLPTQAATNNTGKGMCLSGISTRVCSFFTDARRLQLFNFVQQGGVQVRHFQFDARANNVGKQLALHALLQLTAVGWHPEGRGSS